MDKQESNKQDSISLVDLLIVFRKNFLFIFLSSMVFFISASVYAWFIASPDYISRADVMIQVEQDASTTSDPNFDLVNAFRLIDTVAELMEKEIILNNAIELLEDLGYRNLSANYLRNGLIVRSSSTSYFINISYVDENPMLAKDVVDKVIEAVIEETNVTNAFPVLTDKIRRTSFASDAAYNSPDKMLFSLIGLLIGLFFSSGIIAIKELFSNQFRNKDEIEQVLELQVLGVIPLMDFKEKRNDKK